MRIIGHLQHPTMKITVFKMDNKLSIKFETGLYEQTYKFRESNEMSSFQDAQHLVDEVFCAAVLARFTDMHRIKTEAITRLMPPGSDETFDEII